MSLDVPPNRCTVSHAAFDTRQLGSRPFSTDCALTDGCVQTQFRDNVQLNNEKKLFALDLYQSLRSLNIESHCCCLDITRHSSMWDR